MATKKAKAKPKVSKGQAKKPARAATPKPAKGAAKKPAAGAARAPARPGAARPRVRAATAKAPPLPAVLRADGEEHAFLREFKARWLTRPDFSSTASLQSQLQGALMLLALGRDAEAEEVVDGVARQVDARLLSAEGWEAAWGALQLSAWLKTARGADASGPLARAAQGPRVSPHRDREWLSAEAAGELKDALERRRLGYLIAPMGGVLRWLNEPGAREKARTLLAQGLDAVRALMK